MADIARFPLPTDTAHVRIESRQYRIFNFDLGEGIVRWKAAVAAMIIAPYWVTLLLIGVTPLSGTGRGGVVFIFPAVVMVWMALRPDAGGRPQYALWLDRGRYLTRRRRPMIATPVARVRPGQPFIVSAQWAVIDADSVAHRNGRQRDRRAGRAWAAAGHLAAATTGRVG